MNFGKTILLSLLFIAATAMTGCKKYLDKTIKADISEADVFRSFVTYQGYVETLYDDVVDWVHLTNSYGEINLGGDDMVPTRNLGFHQGDYFFVLGNGNSPYYNANSARASGTWNGNPVVRRHAIWQNSWFGIRAANMALAHLNDLADATSEQKRVLEGQALYFRGYFHWELVKAWGKIPYIDKVFAASDEMRLPQLGLHEITEK
jgi:starch-binding outer membrane protein, SusD/RagB family